MRNLIEASQTVHVHTCKDALVWPFQAYPLGYLYGPEIAKAVSEHQQNSDILILSHVRLSSQLLNCAMRWLHISAACSLWGVQSTSRSCIKCLKPLF